MNQKGFINIVIIIIVVAIAALLLVTWIGIPYADPSPERSKGRAADRPTELLVVLDNVRADEDTIKQRLETYGCRISVKMPNEGYTNVLVTCGDRSVDELENISAQIRKEAIPGLKNVAPQGKAQTIYQY